MRTHFCNCGIWSTKTIMERNKGYYYFCIFNNSFQTLVCAKWWLARSWKRNSASLFYQSICLPSFRLWFHQSASHYWTARLLCGSGLYDNQSDCFDFDKLNFEPNISIVLSFNWVLHSTHSHFVAAKKRRICLDPSLRLFRTRNSQICIQRNHPFFHEACYSCRNCICFQM